MADILPGDSVCVLCDRNANAAAGAPGGRPRQDVDVCTVGGVRCCAHCSLDHHDGGTREPHSVGESLELYVLEELPQRNSPHNIILTFIMIGVELLV